MSCMEFDNLQVCNLRQLHTVWKGLHNPLPILKATVMAQLLITMYPLSTSHTAGSNKRDLCTFYKQELETTNHFLIHCSALAETRQPYINSILDTCYSLMVPVNPETLTYHTIDSTDTDTPPYYEELCRNVVFKMHHRDSVHWGRYKM